MNEKTTPSVFEVLSKINCEEHIEKKKNGSTELSYLSWPWAWHICKEHYPHAFYTIYEREDGRPYFDDGRTCWVKTGVTIEGQEHIEYLPIMDYRNASIPLERVTSMDMNKAIQRSLTKALARHGLGLYIYAGEDLPWSEEEAKAFEAQQAEKPVKKAAGAKKAAAPAPTPAAPEKAPQKSREEQIRDAWVKAIAENRIQPDGSSPRDAYIAKFNPSEAQLDEIDGLVFDYRMDHDTKKN